MSRPSKRVQPTLILQLKFYRALTDKEIDSMTKFLFERFTEDTVDRELELQVFRKRSATEFAELRDAMAQMQPGDRMRIRVSSDEYDNHGTKMDEDEIQRQIDRDLGRIRSKISFAASELGWPLKTQGARAHASRRSYDTALYTDHGVKYLWLRRLNVVDVHEGTETVRRTG